MTSCVKLWYTMRMENYHQFLTVKETQAALRLSRPTVMKLINAGELYAVKLGWQWRIPRAEIDKRLESLEKTV